MNLPESWSLVPLETIALPEKGAIRRGPFGGSLKKDIFVESGFKVYEQQNAINNNFQIGHYFIDEEKYREMEGFSVKPKDLIISCAGTIGRIAIAPNDVKPGVINQALMRIRPNTEIVSCRYLKWLLESPKYQRDIFGKSAGSALKNLAAISEIKKCEIPLPPLEEQRRIAAILDKADAVRRKRKEAIALTEELLRSAFLEMFGDPVTNPQGWKAGTILDIVSNQKKDVRCGPFGTQLKVHEIVSDGIPLYGIENVKGGRFQSKTEKYLTHSKAKELESFDIQPGDVLVTRMGTIGRACVVPVGVGESRFSYHLFRVRPDSTRCLPGFLSSTITWSGTFLAQLEQLAHGAIMSGLKTADLKEVRFLVPPIELQKHYLKVVSKTEDALNRQIQTLNQEDDLFNSLLQRAFRGEL